jgi:hypothetical protein
MADLDLSGILSMFNATPSLEERRQAANASLMRMGLGILAGNQPSRTPVNPLGVLAQGGMGGMDAYQGSLDKQLADRRANAGLSLQALQFKKEMDKQDALKGLLSQSQPRPLGQQALTQGAAAGDVGPTVTNAARMDALQAAPRQSYTPIPLDKLATAAAGGVNIDPFIKLNEQVMAKPASVPFHYGDMTPAQARQFMLEERQAGASKNITNVNAFTPASEEAQKDFMKGSRARYDTLVNAPTTLQNIEKAKALVPEARGFMGPGGESLLEAAKFLNNRVGTSINTDGVKSAEELRTRIFFQIMDNLKKMDAQPSQMQQQIMMDSLGKLGTDPNALPNILNAYADTIKGKVTQHNAEVQSAMQRGVKFPYDPVIKLDAAPEGKSFPAPSKAAINRLKMNPKEKDKFEEIFGPGSAGQYGVR